MCNSCKLPKCHVFVQSSIIKPIHIFKVTKTQTYCHAHYDNEAEASSFFNLYGNSNHTLCQSLKDTIIKPSRKNGSDIIYDNSLVQRRVNEHVVGWCTCNNTENNTDDASNNDDDGVLKKIEDLKENIKVYEQKLEAMKKNIKDYEQKLEAMKKKLELLEMANRL